MRTCWFTSGRQPRRTCYRHSRKRTRQHISVSDTVAFALATNGLLLERRLDEERLQFEAKRREREEQHLFLTAKVKLHYHHRRHFISFVCRLSRMRLSLIMRASISRVLTRRIGHLRNFQH